MSAKYHNKSWIHNVITLNCLERVDYRQSPIGYQHYSDKQLEPVAVAILPFIGLDFDSLMYGQMGLFGQ